MKKQLLLITLLFAAFSAQAMDNQTITERVQEYVLSVLNGPDSQRKQDVIALLQEKGNNPRAISAPEVINLLPAHIQNRLNRNSTRRRGKSTKELRHEWREAFRRSAAEFMQHDTLKSKRNIWNAVRAKVSAFKQALLAVTKSSGKQDVDQQPLRNIAPQKSKSLKSKLADRVRNSGKRVASYVECMNNGVRSLKNELVDKFSKNEQDDEYEEAGMVVKEEVPTVTSILEQGQNDGGVVASDSEESVVEQTVQPQVASQPESGNCLHQELMRRHPEFAEIFASQREDREQRDQQRQRMQSVIQEIHQRNNTQQSQSIWINHKRKILAALGTIGTIGTLIAGYKFFATKEQQIKILKDADQEALKITNAFINGTELKSIELDTQKLTRLTQANQKALQKHVDAFNTFVGQVEDGTNKSSTKVQAGVLCKVGSALNKTIATCLKQLKEEPVRKPGLLHAVADKFGTFCASVKYYAWDKWVTKKQVKIA